MPIALRRLAVARYARDMAKQNERVQTVEKFQKLAQLALSEEEGEPTEEARNAAVKAIHMLVEEDEDGKRALLVIPRAEWETKSVDGASAKALEKAKKQGQKEGAIAVGALALLSGKLKL